MEIVKQSILRQIYKPRPDWSHKGDFGKLLVVGGSKRYSGSPTFNALAAYRAGVDLVTVAAPRRAADIIASFAPDIITYPLEGDYLNETHLDDIFLLAQNSDALAIGGGLERNEKTMVTVRKILKGVTLPCVIDADAIHAVANDKKVLRENFIVTPHSHEFFVLTRKKPEPNVKKRVDLVKKEASKVGCIILLKGHVDVISDGKKVAINKTGCPEMTVGGTGDTLTGICGALLARKVEAFEAACAACFINGKAGELAAKKFGEGLMASDLLEEIPKVLKSAGH
jgi:NAD(P)H-hydrate epimerase